MTSTSERQPDLSELAEALGVTVASARRILRASVTLPDGREVRGRMPGASGGNLEEHRLRDLLAEQLGGITEAVLPYGRADVMTSAAVFEVEHYRKWRHGARQVLAYSAQCGLPPALALFGAIHGSDLLDLHLKLRGEYGYPRNKVPLALWWWTGSRWQHITSRGNCTNMPAGAWFTACPCGTRIVHLGDGDQRAGYELDGTRVHHCPQACSAVSHLFREDHDCPRYREYLEYLAQNPLGGNDT